MRKLLTLAILLFVSACTSRAYEFHFQTNVPQTSYYILFKAGNVIGTQFNSDGTISGMLDYYEQDGGCSRWSCPQHKWSCQSAVWDSQGNFISATLLQNITASYRTADPCPTSATILFLQTAATPVNSPANSEQVYAQNGASTTGRDTRGFGFVDLPAPHGNWATTQCHVPECGTPIPDQPYSFSVQIISDGDLPLDTSTASVSTNCGPCYYNSTSGNAIIVSGFSDDCPTTLEPGSTCAVHVSYDPNYPVAMTTTSPYGLAYVNFLLYANVSGPWEESFTVTGVPQPEE